MLAIPAFKRFLLISITNLQAILLNTNSLSLYKEYACLKRKIILLLSRYSPKWYLMCLNRMEIRR